LLDSFKQQKANPASCFIATRTENQFRQEMYFALSLFFEQYASFSDHHVVTSCYILFYYDFGMIFALFMSGMNL